MFIEYTDKSPLVSVIIPVYKAECFKEIRFPDGYNYEDVLITVRVMTQIAEKGGSLTFLPARSSFNSIWMRKN